MGLTFASFHGCGKTPLIKLLLIRYDILGHKISGAIFNFLDHCSPIQWPLYCQGSSKIFTNELLIVGMLNDVLIGTFELTYSDMCLKSDFSAGSFGCEAIFTKYLLKTSAISLSSEICRSFSFNPLSFPLLLLY